MDTKQVGSTDRDVESRADTKVDQERAGEEDSRDDQKGGDPAPRQGREKTEMVETEVD